MISAKDLTQRDLGYQEVMNMVEARIKTAAEEHSTRVVIAFKKHTQYGVAVVAELQANGYLAEVVYQNTSQGGGVYLHVNWNRDTSEPVTWWEQFKHNWCL